MKKFLASFVILAALTVMPASAQIKLGVKGGMNSSSMKIDINDLSNLTSKNGGIGTAEQVINIAGSDLVYSTDRYGAQVNASAQRSIYLTEATAGGDI